MAEIETKIGTTRESAGTKGTKRAAKRVPRPRLATNSRMVPPAARPKRRMVAVTSGKGGVGKTNIVTNLALALARQGTRVLVVDGDLGLANVDLLLGVAPQYDLQDVILGQRSIRDVVFEGPDGIQVLPASSGVEELANLDEFRTECLIRSLSELDNDVDIILIDSPSGIGRNAISMVQAADQILVVTTPEPTSFSDAYAMIKVLSRHPIKCVPSLLVNQANSEDEALSVARRVRTVAKRFLNLDIEYWGCVLDDESVAKSVMRQEPFLSTYPYSPAASCIYSLARRILGQEPKPAPPNAAPTNTVSRDEVPERV